MALNNNRKSSSSPSPRNSSRPRSNSRSLGNSTRAASNSRPTSSSRSFSSDSRSLNSKSQSFSSNSRSSNVPSRNASAGRQQPNYSRYAAPEERNSFGRQQNRGTSLPTDYHSISVGELDSRVKRQQGKMSYGNYIAKVLIVFLVLLVLFIGGLFLYNSSLFPVESVTVSGLDHLEVSKMTELAAVPENSTLLRVDESGIRERLSKEPWVESVAIKRVFPNTLELAIKERSIAAVVDVPVNEAQNMETWAIASDGIWLMPLPIEGSPDADAISPKIYQDAALVLKITEVPYGINPQIGNYCEDENINNALAIVDGFTTSLKDQIGTVSATGTETTTLILKNGIEIAFGNAERIRDKERVCQKLMEEYAGSITYINVRIVDRPTWRTI